MNTMQDGAGNTVFFSATGDLLAFHSRGQTWELAAPTPGWSLLFAADGELLPARPQPGSGAVISRDDARWTVAYRHVLREDGRAIDVAVQVFWMLADGLLHARLELGGLGPDWTLHAVVLPDMTLAYGEKTRLVVPREAGWLIEDAAQAFFLDEDAPGVVDFPYPGTQHMQCFGWMDGERGLYMDCRDTEGWIKAWRFAAEEAGVFRLQTRHETPRVLDPAGTFRLPYAITLGGFAGGWYEVAQIYRPWALQTVWASRGPEKRQGSYLSEIACWLWNRGRTDHVAPPAKELAKRLGAPVALDWYWWHKHGYDTEYPDYFPPREGEERFRDAVHDLQDHDVYVQVYTNGMCYDLDGAAWQPDGPLCALIREDGSYKAPAYNTFTNHHLAHTCGAAQRWREIVLGFIDNACALDVDGLYLDMIAAVGGQEACFHPAHGHAPGGGSYGVQGFRELLQQAREKAPKLALSSEATLECYMDLLDGYITPGVSLERLKWQAAMYGGRSSIVPLFSAVYHGHCVCFGNYDFLDGVPPFDEPWPAESRPDPAAEKDWPALYPDQFALELARTICFGFQPMVCNLTAAHFEDPRLQADLDFLVTASRFYYDHRPHLLWGRMLPPGELDCPAVAVDFLQRFIFTAPGEETTLSRSFPRVFHSAWEAPDGSCGVVMINHSRKPAEIVYRHAAGLVLTPNKSGQLRAENEILTGCLPARSCRFVPLMKA